MGASWQKLIQRISKEVKIIAIKYVVSFVKTNRVESWNKYHDNIMAYKTGSWKHFDDRGTLWLINHKNLLHVSFFTADITVYTISF